MTPDQYRREGAEAMREAVVSLMQRLIKPRQVDISREGMQLAAQGRPNVKYALRRMDLDARMSCRDLIQSIDVDEVLAGLRPQCDECDDEGILPCPFCGGPAEITEIDDGENAGGSCICCTKCLASGNVEFGFKENFVSNWNRRVQTPVPDAVARLVEAARAALNYLENTEGEFGITLESATDIRTALAAMETSHAS